MKPTWADFGTVQYAWVSEDECAPDLRGHQSRLRPTAIPPALECRSATRFTPRLRAASRSGDDARGHRQLHPDVSHMRRVSPPRVSLYSMLGCELKKARSAPAASSSTHAVLVPLGVKLPKSVALFWAVSVTKSSLPRQPLLLHLSSHRIWNGRQAPDRLPMRTQV